MDGLMYGKRQLEDIQRYVLSMDTSVEEYLEMGVTVLIVWTRQLQDPSHREEQETCLSLSMDQGKANIDFLPVEYL